MLSREPAPAAASPRRPAPQLRLPDPLRAGAAWAAPHGPSDPTGTPGPPGDPYHTTDPSSRFRPPCFGPATPSALIASTAPRVARPTTSMTSSMATSVRSPKSTIGSRNWPSRFRNSSMARLSAWFATSYFPFLVVAPCWGFPPYPISYPGRDPGATSRCGLRQPSPQTNAGSPGSRAECVHACMGSLTAQGPETSRALDAPNVAFRLPERRRHPGVATTLVVVQIFRGSIPSLHFPLSTLHPALSASGA